MEENKIATILFGILVISKRLWSQIPHDNPESTNISLQWIGEDTCLRASRLNKMAMIYEMHEDDIIFSANQGDSSMEDEDLEAKEIKEAYGEIEYSEEVAGFQINEKCTKMISIH